MINISATKTNCFCLLNSSNESVINGVLIRKLIEYFRSKNVFFSHYSTIDNKYKDQMGKIKNVDELVKSNVHIIDLFSNEDSMNADFLLSISQGNEHTNSCIFVELIKEHKLDFKDFAFLQECCYKIDYGFSFTGAKGKYSQSYVLGFKRKSRYLKDISRKNQILYDEWFKVNKNIRDGLMRDIYRDNFLNATHINKQCKNGMKLSDLIQSDTSYGFLEKIKDSLYYWKVEPENLEKTRKRLYQEQFLL